MANVESFGELLAGLGVEGQVRTLPESAKTAALAAADRKSVV